jgi:hypothetical protein
MFVGRFIAGFMAGRFGGKPGGVFLAAMKRATDLPMALRE